MPTYTYQCKKCAHEFELFHSMGATPRVKCPECDAACKRLLGTGAGIIFKGSGFYETDYKNKSSKSASSTSSSKSDSGSAAKSASDSTSKASSTSSD